jgi:alpha-1,6-mannosyltransferase
MMRTAVLWALPLLLAAPLASRDIYAYACQGRLYAAGFSPYAAGPAALPSPWLHAMSAVWLNSPAPYGPLAILVSGLAAAASGGHLLVALGWLRLAALAGVVLIAVFVPRLARACGTDPAVATWLGVASPLIAVDLLSAAHHDALTIGLLLAGLDCAARGRGRLAGIALGLAAAVKVTAIITLPFAVVLVAAATVGRRRLTRSSLTVAVPAVAVFLAVTAISGLGFGWVRAAPGPHSIIHWLSLPTGFGLVTGALLRLVGVAHGVPTGVTVVRSVALYAVLPVTLTLLWWRIRHSTETRRIVEYAGIALAVTVLLSPLVYPWYFIAPVSVLAAATDRPRIRTGLAVLCVAGVFVILPDGFNLARATMWPGAFVEVIAVLVVAVRYYARRRRDPG